MPLMIKSIFSELETPDDQGNSWYDWACNQLSHAMLGVVIAMYFPVAPIQMAAIIAALKECTDLARVPELRTLRDSVQDLLFWVLGAWIVSAGDYLTTAVILTSFALLIGIIPRARKAIKNGK